MNPVLSIITVVYNGELFIERTIESIVNQTFSNFEHIIIDGNSTDKTVEIVEKYKKQYTKLVSEPDRGVYDAMNKGLKAAKGKYILFINAGDELSKPTILDEIFALSKDADILYGETLIMNKENEVIGTRTELTSRKLPVQLSKKHFLEGQVVSHQSFIVKRELAPLYDLTYRCSADIDWMLRTLTKSSRVINADQPISKYLQGGISDTQLFTCWKERFMIMLKHFSPLQVFLVHVKFAFRFISQGAYKKH